MNITNLSLSLTRKTLYVGIVIFSVFGILLPWSILAYWRFYNVLIPIESYRLPMKIRPINHHAIVLHPESDLVIDKLIHLDPSTDLDYDIVLDVSLICEADDYAGYLNISMSHSTNTTDLKGNTMLLDCHKERIYRKHNWWIPYKLKLWVPPVLVLPDYSIIDSVSLGITNAKNFASTLNNGEVIEIKLDTYPYATFLVDIENTFLNINVNWKGIRWFVFYHYILCFVLGVGLFWGVSCGVCLSLALVIWGTGGVKTNDKKTQTHQSLAIKGEWKSDSKTQE